jgi:DNA-binding transcriptional MerR regulator
MTLGPVQDSPSFSLPEAALRLEVEEATIREWLSNFNWQRNYDGQGHMYLTIKDIEFLRVIKSLKDVDRSCDSIVRIIGGDDTLAVDVLPAEPAAEAAEPEPVRDPMQANLDQIETLKAELLELHAKPNKRPFWKFW